jgi:hypothetical protein
MQSDRSAPPLNSTQLTNYCTGYTAGLQHPYQQVNTTSSQATQGSFGDRHPTLCAVGPSGLGRLGDPIIGAALHWWCNHSG